MKIDVKQLKAQLSNGSAFLFFVYSSEYILLQEACDLIKKAQGNDAQKQTIVIDKGFDIDLFEQDLKSFSLFSSKKFYHLILNATPKPTINNKLIALLESLPKDITVLISCEKMGKQLENTKLFKAIDKHGLTVAVWPPTYNMKSWIIQRASDRNIILNSEATDLLISKTEGNLLALTQEIEKLSLLFSGKVNVEQIKKTISDSREFEVYALGDNILDNNTRKSLAILKSLFINNTEPTLILWSITDTLKTIAKLIVFQRSMSFTQAANKLKIWPKKQELYSRAIKEFELANVELALKKAVKIDHLIKQGKHQLAYQLTQDLIINLPEKNSQVC